jgi:hypothetical protein
MFEIEFFTSQREWERERESRELDCEKKVADLGKDDDKQPSTANTRVSPLLPSWENQDGIMDDSLLTPSR